jgi:phage repressor protein C with HTH and peptisase S24 domain
MKFKALQENLRKILWDRIAGGNLTGLRLAAETGFRQAHISNFLNRKRGLSLEGMDKVLQVQRISVLDLLDPAEINKRASILPPSEDAFENIVLVDGKVAATEVRVTSGKIKEILKFKRYFIRKLRPRIEGDRAHWTRFLLIRVDGREGMSMYPRLLPGATVLIDRHYNSLTPYRKRESNMYAIAKDGNCTIKYVELAGNHLVLRPHNQAYPVAIMRIGQEKRAHDYLVGRVCHIAIET